MKRNAAIWLGTGARPFFAPDKIILILLGTAICTFGICNVHRQAGITEGGALGLVLLLDHWFGLPVPLTSLMVDALCYALAFTALGGGFLLASAFSGLCMAGFFRLWESFPPMLPDLSSKPLAAAAAGALFVGIGVGLVIRGGGSCGGDDALALFIRSKTGWRISGAYLISDLAVLALSLSYIPLDRIFFSLITVALSSLIIGAVQGTGGKAAGGGEGR